jgi:hypothetical protein
LCWCCFVYLCICANTWIDKTTPSNYLHRQDYTSKTVWIENTTPVNMSRKTKQHQYKKNYLDRQNNTSKEYMDRHKKTLATNTWIEKTTPAKNT